MSEGVPLEPVLPIEGGEAQPKAESMPDPLADLSSLVDQLSGQITAADAMSDEEITAAVLESRNLFAQELATGEAIQKGEVQIEYFKTRQELGQFQDAKSQELIANLEATIQKAKVSLEELRKKADAIAQRPEVMSRMKEEADKDQEGFEKIEKAKALIEEIVALNNERNEAWNTLQGLGNPSSLLNVFNKAHATAYNKALEISKKAKSPTVHSDIMGFVDGRITGDDLLAIRKKLGLFNGKDKAVIDEALETVGPLIVLRETAREELTAGNTRAQEADSKFREKVNEYGRVSGRIHNWAEEEKLDKLFEKKFGQGWTEFRWN